MSAQTPGEKLVSAVSSVDWARNVSLFAASPGLKEQVEKANYRFAIWAKQLENAETENPAMSFIREAQVQGHYAATLIALGLYKPAASAMRGMFESALYYTYFRTHPVELATLLREPNYFVDVKTILRFHKEHSVDFTKKQEKLGLVSRIDAWYASTSAIVHGQIPGKWTTHKRVQDIAFNEIVCKQAVTAFEQGEEVTHRLLLCIIDTSHWYKFRKAAKEHLLKGLPGDVKELLALSSS